MQENVIKKKRTYREQRSHFTSNGKMDANGWSICSHLTGQH